jgi:putative methionine-R-sulfoxide reductase with GAF domain
MSNIQENSTNNNEEKMKKLNKMIESREKQLSDMANMLADLNQQLNDVFLISNVNYLFIFKDPSQK